MYLIISYYIELDYIATNIINFILILITIDI